MKPAILVEKLSKRYGTVEALREVSLIVAETELFGLIGADGAGKTTLLRILATLLLPDNGRAEVLGLDTGAGFRTLRTRIGYMPGRFSLYQDLSVEENLNFFATVFGTTVRENYELIRDIYVQLEPYRTRRAGQLSGGMKQKLALCCALVHKPELLLLDEPTTGVDAVSRQEFWQMLRRLKLQGITIVVSTPYMDEAVLCDRVAFIQEGRILAIDTPQGITRLFKKPLFSVRARDRHRLIVELRRYEYAHSAYAFGNSVHYTDRRSSADPSEITAWLRSLGFEEIDVVRIVPGIEDTFMALIEEPSPIGEKRND
jgi:ABC-type multidrug transport system ATPase subunit